MIYSASRRTDLVAFFPNHIIGRVARSRKLEALVLWTKDPRNLIEHAGLRSALCAVPTVVQVTVTGMAGSPWEPHVPPVETVIASLAEVCGLLPARAIQWRFDPIIATDDLLQRFQQIMKEMTSKLKFIPACTVSFFDPYRKAVKRLERAGLSAPELDEQDQRRILAELVESGRRCDPSFCLRLCCEPHLLDAPGTLSAHCIDGELFDRLYGTQLADLPKDGGQRPACGCIRSTDIGSYDQACRHGCLYCYARPDESACFS